MRAALYARYSDERQNERSIEDQFELCRRHAEARGWTVVARFDDAAISGQAMANRPGVNALLAAAEAGAFDLVLVEHEDRLARRLAHMAYIADTLEYAGVQLATLATDRVEDMHVAINGLQASQYSKNLSAKTKRGMHSNAEKGMATGSRTYGYRTAPGGTVEIVEAEAEVIRRAFHLFVVEKLTGRDVADRFNREGIPGPRGGPWNASTINGSRQRANGILQTELYAGVKVWNRLDTRKNPRTGKKLSRVRPEAEWKRTPVPHLAIVSADLFAQAQARKRSEIPTTAAARRRRCHTGPFSGLLKCGRCGATYTVYTGGRLICSGFRERGATACTNRRTLSRAQVERRVLEGLQAQLLAPEAVALYVRAYHAAWARQATTVKDERGPLERRLGELTRAIDRAVDAVVGGFASEAVKARLMAMEQEKAAVEARLAVEPAPRPVTLHPRAAEAYAARVEALQAELAAGGSGDAPSVERATVEAVRDLIERIDLTPVSDEDRAQVDVTIHARAWRALGLPAPAVSMPLAPQGLHRSSGAAAARCGDRVVAGGGIGTTPLSAAEVAGCTPLRFRLQG